MVKHDSYIRVRLPENLFRGFKDYAEKNDTTISALVREYMQATLRKDEDA